MRNQYKQLQKFGRTVFKLYEKRPILMNSTVGCIVYVAGEIVVEVHSSKHNDSRKIIRELDWKRVSSLGVLGAFENGIVTFAA